jgi:hypothetical protein
MAGGGLHIRTVKGPKLEIFCVRTKLMTPERIYHMQQHNCVIASIFIYTVCMFCNSSGLATSARIKRWRDTTPAEMKAFIALVIYQGVIRKPDSRMFWSTSAIVETPFVPSVMSANRFYLLERCLHFTDTSIPLPPTASATAKVLWRIDPFFTPLIANFRTVYTPTQCIAVDESLMLWKGRLGVKQYIPLKRARWGLKSYELCEAGSGYIWNSIVHTGRADQMNLVHSSDGLTSSRIVLTLMEGLLGLGHRVYMDNFYSSPLLYVDLLRNGTDAVGTARVNRRGMPPSFSRKIPRGTTCARFTDQVMAIKWHDKKEVTMLSTSHDGTMKTIQTFRGPKVKPAVVLDYNTNMGAVDLADQMLTAYPMDGKRKVAWYKKFFRHLINQAILNSYAINRKVLAGRVTHVEFRLQLISQLLIEHCTNRATELQLRRGGPAAVNPLRLIERHFPQYVPATATNAAPLRDCTICCRQKDRNGKKVRQRTRYQCGKCGVGLCAAPCFETYHTEL